MGVAVSAFLYRQNEIAFLRTTAKGIANSRNRLLLLGPFGSSYGGGDLSLPIRLLKLYQGRNSKFRGCSCRVIHHPNGETEPTPIRGDPFICVSFSWRKLFAVLTFPLFLCAYAAARIARCFVLTGTCFLRLLYFSSW